MLVKIVNEQTPLPPGAFQILLICFSARLLPQLSRGGKREWEVPEEIPSIKPSIEIHSFSSRFEFYPHINIEEYAAQEDTNLKNIFCNLGENNNTQNATA